MIGVKLSPLKTCFDDFLLCMVFESVIFDLRVRISIISAKILKILKTHPLPPIHLDKSYTIFWTLLQKLENFEGMNVNVSRYLHMTSSCGAVIEPRAHHDVIQDADLQCNGMENKVCDFHDEFQPYKT